MFALQSSSRCSVVAVRPSRPARALPSAATAVRRVAGINNVVVNKTRGPAPAAAFGLGGGNKNKPSSSSSPSSTSDALASAAAEVEAAAAKVGDAVSEAAEALASEVAAEAAEGGAAVSSAADAAATTKSFVAPAAAAAAKQQQSSSSSSSPLRPSNNNRRQQQQQQQKRSSSGGILSLPPFKNDRRRPSTPAARRARGLTRLVLFAGVAWALLSLGAAVMKVARKANSPRAKRLRTVDKNKRVVDALNEVFLPASVTGNAVQPTLTPALAKKLKSETGFTGPEVFRKYLWYLLRERRFDSTAVADLVSLRGALALTDDDVASALRERAQRIYDKYGNVMMDVAGMTKAGIERKATCRALFSKLLYLAESDEMLNQEGEAAKALDIASVFGATDDDASKLRIVSLVEVDLDKLEGQFGGGGGGGGGGFFDEGAAGGGGGGGGSSGW